jgi:hypothetical protein
MVLETTDAQARVNAFDLPSDMCPSNYPGMRLRNSPRGAPNFSTDAQASALDRNSIPGRNTYVSSTPPDQSVGETSHATFENSPARPVPAPFIGNNGSLVQGLVAGYGLIPSLTRPVPNDPTKPCVCTSQWWFAWCPRALEHFRYIRLYSSWFIHYPCCCGWALSMPQLPRWCPKVASHFLDWVSHDHPIDTRSVG